MLTQKTMTKEVFANAVAKKAVPVAGAFISGGLTYASFKPGAERLRKHLRSLPVSGIDKSEVDGATKNVVDEAVENASKAVCSAGAAAVSAGEQAGKALADGVAAVGGVVGKGAQAAGVSSKKAPRLQAERLKAVCAWLVKDSVMPQRESVGSSVLSERNNHARF